MSKKTNSPDAPKVEELTDSELDEASGGGKIGGFDGKGNDVIARGVEGFTKKKADGYTEVEWTYAKDKNIRFDGKGNDQIKKD